MNPRLSFIVQSLIPVALFGLGLYLIALPDFLFWWDERFHALVAKNLLEDPSFTRLYPQELESVLSGTRAWYQDPVWLHKPPLFSYVQALSMRIFGSNLIAMRLPSLLALLALYFSFRQILLYQKWQGLSASLIALGICLNPFLLKLMMGWQGMDHNDLAFIAWISLGIVSILSYRKKPHILSLLVIALLVAAAVLTKWLTGLLALLFWALTLAFAKKRQELWKPFLSGILSLILVIPWQLYSYGRFPERWKETMLFNSRHFSEVIENHSGAWYFHFEQWGSHFFLLLTLSLIFAILHFWKSRASLDAWSKAGWWSLVFVLLFFSLAATKLPAFTLIGLALFVVGISGFKLKSRLRNGLVLGFLGLTMAQMAWLPAVNFSERYPVNLHRAQFYRDLDLQLPERSIIIGARQLTNIEGMFYCKHLILDAAEDPEVLERLMDLPYPIYQLQYDGSGLELGLEPIRSDRQ